MLAPWLELPGAAERVSLWSSTCGLDLARLGTTATAEEITDTAITQPLVVAATLLAHEELTKRGLLTGADAGANSSWPGIRWVRSPPTRSRE